MKYLSHVLSLMILSYMGYVTYTGDTTYINIVDVYYLFICILGSLSGGLVSIGRNTLDKERCVAMANIVSGLRVYFKYVCFIASVILLAGLGYKYILLWYIFTTLGILELCYWCKRKLPEFE